MITLLHVIGADGEAATLHSLKVVLQRLRQPEHAHVVLMPHALRARLSPWIGDHAGIVDLPSGSPAAGALAALKILSIARNAAAAGNAVIHAWTPQAFNMVWVVRDIPTVVSLGSMPANPRWLRVAASSKTRFVVDSNQIRIRLARRGINPETVAVVRTAVDFQSINAARKLTLRSQLVGSDDGPVVLVPGPASRAGRHFQAVWAAAILQQIYPQTRVIVPFGGREYNRIKRFLNATKLGTLWIETPRDWSWPELTTVADVMVDASRVECRTEPMAWAMGAGLPIIGLATRATTELIADRHNGMLSRESNAHPLASVMLRLLEDHDLRRNVAETARGQAYEVFSVRAYTDNMRQIYANLLADKPVGEGVLDTAVVQARM